MIQFQTNYEYLGSRQYVNGPTLLIDVLDMIESQLDIPIYLKRIKFQREVVNNGQILLSKDAQALNRIDDAKWYLTCQIGDDRWHTLFFEEDIPVSKRVEVHYPVNDIESDNNFGGIGHVFPVNRRDLSLALVEANKQLHQKCLIKNTANMRIRLGYIEDWHIPHASIGLDSFIEVKNLRYQKLGSGFMTINRLIYTVPGGKKVSLLMCFDVRNG